MLLVFRQNMTILELLKQKSDMPSGNMDNEAFIFEPISSREEHKNFLDKIAADSSFRINVVSH